MSKNNPYGDDGGTRVGRPDTPKRDNLTESGNEAARGIHDANKKGSPARPGSEPLKERENQHKSGYGGENGKPRRSSDQH
jgi:hypothetical protein